MCSFICILWENKELELELEIRTSQYHSYGIQYGSTKYLYNKNAIWQVKNNLGSYIFEMY